MATNTTIPAIGDIKTLQRIKDDHIRWVLDMFDGSTVRAATVLDCSSRFLQYWKHQHRYRAPAAT